LVNQVLVARMFAALAQQSDHSNADCHQNKKSCCCSSIRAGVRLYVIHRAALGLLVVIKLIPALNHLLSVSGVLANSFEPVQQSGQPYWRPLLKI